jgi:hypothetical protein
MSYRTYYSYTMNHYQLLLGLLIILTLSNLRSQNHRDNRKFEELFLLYTDEEYDKCLKKALNATQDDESRRHPLPYLYASMIYYEYFVDEELNLSHPQALKNAMKYAARFRKKDDNNNYLVTYAWFLPALTKEAYAIGSKYYEWNDYRKAYSLFKKVVRFAPNDLASQLMLGMSASQVKSTRDANVAFSNADTIQHRIQNEQALRTPIDPILRNALLHLYSFSDQYPIRSKQLENYVKLGEARFPKDPDIQEALLEFYADKEVK